MARLQIERTNSLAILRMSKSRANALDEAFVGELIHAIGVLEVDDRVRGVLLASGHPKLFCPGLDLVSLIEYDRPAMRRFLGVFAELVHNLYASKKPLVCAVNGHAVAGGCILALTADYRIAKPTAQIGLNEVKVGVPLPWSVGKLLEASVGRGSLARVALLGRNFAGDEAIRIGLVDELADDDSFESVCLERLEEFAEKDPYAFGVTKRYLRAATLELMKERESALLGDFLDGWFSEGTQKRIRDTIAALQSKG